MSEAEVLARLPDALKALVEGLLKLTYWRGFADGFLVAGITILAALVIALVVRRVP